MKKYIIYILVLILVLTGCSAKAPTPTSEPVKNDSSHETENTKELPEAIKPGADITIKSGHYNLSEHIEEIWDGEGGKWNESHRYVKLRECYTRKILKAKSRYGCFCI